MASTPQSVAKVAEQTPMENAPIEDAPLAVRFKSDELHARIVALCCVVLWLITLNLCLPLLRKKDLTSAALPVNPPATKTETIKESKNDSYQKSK